MDAGFFWGGCVIQESTRMKERKERKKNQQDDEMKRRKRKMYRGLASSLGRWGVVLGKRKVAGRRRRNRGGE